MPPTLDAVLYFSSASAQAAFHKAIRDGAYESRVVDPNIRICINAYTFYEQVLARSTNLSVEIMAHEEALKQHQKTLSNAMRDNKIYRAYRQRHPSDIGDSSSPSSFAQARLLAEPSSAVSHELNKKLKHLQCKQAATRDHFFHYATEIFQMCLLMRDSVATEQSSHSRCVVAMLDGEVFRAFSSRDLKGPGFSSKKIVAQYHHTWRQLLSSLKDAVSSSKQDSAKVLSFHVLKKDQSGVDAICELFELFPFLIPQGINLYIGCVSATQVVGKPLTNQSKVHSWVERYLHGQDLRSSLSLGESSVDERESSCSIM